VPNPRPAAPPRIGSDATEILAALGYTVDEVDRLKAGGIIGPVEWFHREPAQPRVV
jgi:crotonobetainyl-CoA:carnitine CoA-transferase CaiB-like acyl-CoA transferase